MQNIAFILLIVDIIYKAEMFAAPICVSVCIN